MKISVRVVIAFVIAPVSFGILVAGLSLAFSSAREGLWVLKFSALVGYPIAIFVGLPAYWLLTKRGLCGIGTYSFVALVFSALLISYFIIWSALSEGVGIGELFLPSRIGQMAIVAFACFSTVFIFWAIARPDKQALVGA